MGKFFSLTSEQREKIRQARLGTHLSAETRLKISLANMGKHKKGFIPTDETRKKLSLAKLGNKNNLGNKASAETRAKMSAIHSGSNNAFYGKTHTEDARGKIALSRMGKPTTAGHKASAETRLRISQGGKGISRKSATRSQTYKELWRDDEWASNRVRNIVQALHARPNKEESTLLDLLNTHFPGDWQYVGDGSVTFGRLNPDFINVNGKKQIIELFGEYWHKPEEEQQRINIFAGFGYFTLVIWASELQNLEATIAKIKAFTKCRTCKSRASRDGNIPGKCRDFIRSIPDGDKEKVRS